MLWLPKIYFLKFVNQNIATIELNIIVANVALFNVLKYI